MLKHGLSIVLLIGCMLLFTALPFLPGEYDSLAVPLSKMAQVLGIVGLLLLPVGIAWLVYELWSGTKRKRHVFALIGLIAASLVSLLVSFATSFESLALGVGVFALWIYVASRILPLVRRTKDLLPTGISAGPFYLTLVPLSVFALQFALATTLTDFSRDRVIQNSASLIADIEQYKIDKGHYPHSIVAVHRDYLPSIIGIKEYRYEPKGEAYSVLFEQHTLSLGAKEIVMYNPRGEQAISSHTADVLQMSAEALALDQTRGHNAEFQTRHPGWKSFVFD